MTRLTLKGDGAVGASYQLTINGEERDGVLGVSLSVVVDEINQAVVTYLCESTEIDGEFEVTHRCGLEDI